MTTPKDKMTMTEFERRLPELFAAGTVNQDKRLQAFLAENPDSAALVRDLEYIAAEAGRLLHPGNQEPSATVWKNIESELRIAAADHSVPRDGDRLD